MASAPAQQSTLRVGSVAPPVTVAKWVKGGPVGKLGAGKVHVVEFWATWCPPCIESIPHLTELAKKYKGKVTFTGVAVWEKKRGPGDTSYLKTVEAFVKEMGPRMNYNVGADGPQDTMAKRWMEAAGQGGIPTAFVVDRSGRIAWIGHPMSGLDEVVAKVVAGTFDVKAEAARKAQEEAEQRKHQKLLQPLVDAYQARNWRKVADESKRLMDANPSMRMSLAATRFEALLRIDEPEAMAYAKELGRTIYKDQPIMLNQIAWAMVDPAKALQDPDYTVAIALAERAVELTKEKDANILDTLALALWKNGDKERALKLQEKAVQIARAEKYPAATRAELEERLAMMKKG